jgi:glycosyltransferase involved in cell wall biosynthesis
MQYKLSILIPARNEEFLGHTIQDILRNSRSETEVIAILDGYLPDPSLESDPRVTIIYNPVSVGQRAGANQAAKLAKGKYLMKVDAHCAFDEGFDKKMLDGFKEIDDNPDKYGGTSENVTMAPTMKNLHVFNWVCSDGHKRYQSPSGPCEECGKPTTKDVVWYPKPSPNSTSFRFDKTMHFQYWGDWGYRQKGDLIESMSLQGSCFMCTREKYFELDICSETDFHSWGQQGVEVACKTWLSGGRVIVSRKTWYAHMFRTRGGDFGFPYSNPGSKVAENRERSRELFQRDKWPKATRKFQWLIDKFKPPEWEITKGMIYYTHNQLTEKITKPVRDKLKEISQEKKMSITCASLKQMDFGAKNIHFPSMKRGYLAMYKQILGALENTSSDILFFTEHDVLYHPSHFDFEPKDKDTFYYNVNVWRTRLSDGHSLKTNDCKQLSGLCGYKNALTTHFKERFKMVEEKEKELSETEFNKWIRHMGHEPMTHGRIKWKNIFKCESWKSKVANIDLKHGKNATGARWKKEQYRNQKWTEGWIEAEGKIPGWGDIMPILNLMK